MNPLATDPAAAPPAAEGGTKPAKPKRLRATDTRDAFLFLLPNLLGVLLFVVFPVVFSLVMAFTNWDLKQHNQFSDRSIEFVGLRNVWDILTEGQFLRFLGNTLFFMMGIPISLAGSLAAAMLLTHDGRRRTKRAMGLAVGVGIAGVTLMLLTGFGLAGLAVFVVGLFAALLGGGLLLGPTLHRTVFYTPFFVSGVATFILWKKLFNPQSGPINEALRPVLAVVETNVNALPAPLVAALPWAGLLAFGVLLGLGLHRLARWHRDGDLGTAATVLCVATLHVPLAVALTWGTTAGWVPHFAIVSALAWAAAAASAARMGTRFGAAAWNGTGTGIVFSILVMTAMFIALGSLGVLQALPGMAASRDGLEPPSWLTSIPWAKPSLMMMGFWAAIGSNNMLLYLAALSGISPELYEAADIDGAKGLQRFWNVTWPQLAPTSFFILVMSVIGGLQGGFEMAKVMTNGGPAGATTTLSYFIYIEGFETGRLGFASAVAWALFVLVLVITLVNWKLGNSRVND